MAIVDRGDRYCCWSFCSVCCSLLVDVDVVDVDGDVDVLRSDDDGD